MLVSQRVLIRYLYIYISLDLANLKKKNMCEVLPSLKRTAKAPENGWLEDDRFVWGPASQVVHRI